MVLSLASLRGALPQPAQNPTGISGTVPIEKRVIASPVNVKFTTRKPDSFEPSDDGEGQSVARIRLQAEPTAKPVDTSDPHDIVAFFKPKDKSALEGKLHTDLAGGAEHAQDGDFIRQWISKNIFKDAHRATRERLLNSFEEALDKLPPGVTEVVTELPERAPWGIKMDGLLRDMSTIAAMRGYNYKFQQADSKHANPLNSILLNWHAPRERTKLNEAVALGKALGESMTLTRHLVDMPANVATTKYVSDKALGLASDTLTVDVLKGDDLEGKTVKNGKRMGLLLSVGQGNVYVDATDKENRQPRLVEMVHTPPGWDPKTGKTVMIVGKGIIFDTGGNNLKPSEYMHNMRGDMAGASAVLGVMKTLEAKPIPNVRVVGLMPLTENRISGKASLPQDIYTARSGKTVEITNTDAEGRLVLADAVNYGMEKYKPDAVNTTATLTGGKTAAIGKQNAVGLAGNNPELIQGLDQVLTEGLGRKTGTLLLNENYKRMVTQGFGTGGHADVVNSSKVEGAIRAGVITAGIRDPIADAGLYAADPSALRAKLGGQFAAFRHQAGFSQFGDGAAFIQTAGLNTLKKDHSGHVKSEEKANTPWFHYDIAGAEFSRPDVRHGGTEWATGVGVQDIYLGLKAIGEGKIKLDPGKTVVQ